MKKLLVLILLALAFIFPTSVLAQSWQKEELVTLSQNLVHDGTYFAAGERVEIFGTINGDAYVAGGMVRMDGTVNGDLIVAGGDVTISGVVTQDVRVAGGDVTISGEIQGEVTALGGNITFENNAQLGSGIVTAGGNIDINTPLLGSLYAAAGNTTINSSIAGNVEGGFGSLRLTPQAQVGGNLTYWSEEEASISSEAVVSGVVSHKEGPQMPQRAEIAAAGEWVATTINFVLGITSLFSTLVIGLILIKLFPKKTSQASQKITDNLGQSLIVGVIAVFLAPTILFLLMLTIIGIPLSFILGFLFMLLMYISRIYVMVAIGTKLLAIARKTKGTQNLGLSFLTGFVVYFLLSTLPVIGGLFKLGAILVGTGAALVQEKDTYLKAREEKIV